MSVRRKGKDQRSREGAGVPGTPVFPPCLPSPARPAGERFLADVGEGEAGNRRCGAQSRPGAASPAGRAAPLGRSHQAGCAASLRGRARARRCGGDASGRPACAPAAAAEAEGGGGGRPEAPGPASAGARGAGQGRPAAPRRRRAAPRPCAPLGIRGGGAGSGSAQPVCAASGAGRPLFSLQPPHPPPQMNEGREGDWKKTGRGRFLSFADAALRDNMFI